MLDSAAHARRPDRPRPARGADRRLDRIFTRAGAADDISRNASTFLVERVEATNILNNASERSLVVLDTVAVREWQDEILFLHKIVDGGTDRS